MPTRSNELEQKALKLILEAEEEGILQSEMWKKLGVSSREGSRLALKFEEKGVVDRRKELSNGRWTYKLYSKRQQVTLTSIQDCSCLSCEDLNKCVSGGEQSPLNCVRLTDWIEEKAIETEAG